MHGPRGSIGTPRATFHGYKTVAETQNSQMTCHWKMEASGQEWERPLPVASTDRGPVIPKTGLWQHQNGPGNKPPSEPQGETQPSHALAIAGFY